MKRDDGRFPLLPVVAALFCVIVAIGAGLEGRFSFSGAIWSPPGSGGPTTKLTTATPQPIHTPAKSFRVSSHSVFTLSWVPIVVVLSILGLAAIVVLVLLWIRRRPRRGVAQKFAALEGDVDASVLEDEAAPDLPTLQRGLARASEVLETDRRPRDAIVRAWVGLQEAAEDSGMSRRSAETPTEFTSRVFAAVQADREAADTLLALYLRVRFGTQPATAEDVRLARDAVDALSATWTSGLAK